MNLEYFKSQICEEIVGAKNYVKLAVATESTDPAWSKNFAEMSKAELDHASKLFKMAEEYYLKLSASEQNGYKGKLYRCIVNIMTEDVAKVRYMHELLNNKSNPASVIAGVTPA